MTRAGVVPARSNKATGKGHNAARTSNGLGYHCLRHTTTTLLKQAGASDVVAREIVGHETAAVSRTYSHIDASTLGAAIDRLHDITSEEGA
jgi:integrase